MNTPRPEMEGLSTLSWQGFEDEDNITIRKSAGTEKSKMAQTRSTLNLHALEHSGSLLIDSILSQDEAEEVVTMLNSANELNGDLGLPSFYTSSQMGGRDPARRPSTPPLSPIADTEKSALIYHLQDESITTPKGVGLHTEEKDGLHETEVTPRAGLINPEPLLTGSTREDIEDGGDVTKPSSGVVNQDSGGEDDTNSEAVPDPITDGVGNGDGEGKHDPFEASDDEGNNGQLSDGEKGLAGDEDTDTEVEVVNPYLDLRALSAKLMKMDDVLSLLDGKTTKYDTAIRGLESSLEFSQREIDGLKKENRELKQKMGAMDLEEKRTQFQMQHVDDKLDKLDTVTKKKNLLIEGIPEADGGKRDDYKAISDLFDQLKVDKGINIEACFRVGPYNRSRDRPILVTFERQTDRDLVYSRRMDLRRSANYQRTWINEDLGPASKRKRGLIRLISREAQQQGIDCKTGKYALHINRVKFDESNLDELPLPLRPTSLKQVRVDKDTLAYQSEYAPFSNFFPCTIVVGAHTFFCLEQAFQFLRAKNLNKPLAATKIYLSRDVRYIRQVAAELGTSDAWETRQFELMYVLLLKKFQQHPELKTLLLSTGSLQLVEATPDRTWGCGATLSSNALRRHEWPGKNKHGEILMTVREYLARQVKRP